MMELCQDAYRHKRDTDNEKCNQLKADDAVHSGSPTTPAERQRAIPATAATLPAKTRSFSI